MFPMKPRILAPLAFLVVSVVLRAGGPEPVSLTSLPDRIRIEVGGSLFSEYIFTGAHRPYLYPILAADGTQLNRDYPMKTPAGEDHDHIHHRSLWFAHSLVDGIDFWNEGAAAGVVPTGSIVHDSIVEVSSGEVGVIRATNKWISKAGRLVCTDDSVIRIRGTAEARFLDYEVTLHALKTEPLLIGDSKDGTIAMRLAQWMTMPHKYLKDNLPGNGHILTSQGARDADAWGKHGDWCDYYAPHNGAVYGVAIFDAPSNLRHPTWWMARDYGLFGANPFGKHDYDHLKNDPHAGDYTVKPGESLTLRYRFYFHKGDPEAAKVADAYAAYVASLK